MPNCQLCEPFGECGPVRTMQQNSDYWHRMYQREKKKREQLEKEADWLAQAAANGGMNGWRVSAELYREKARQAVERAEKETK